MSNWPIATDNPIRLSAPFNADVVWVQPINGAAAHTKGAWVQVAGSTAYDAAVLYIGACTPLDNSGERWLFDVAIGAAGSEQVIVANLPLVNGSYKSSVLALGLPLSIPRGSRLSVRAQSSLASPTAQRISVQLGLQARHPLGLTPYTKCTTLGANEATTSYVATPVRYGNPLYTELSSGTSLDARAVVLLTAGASVTSYMPMLLNLATGAGGVEVPVIEGVTAHRYGPGSYTSPVTIGPVRCPIPAGSRLSIAAIAGSTSGDVQLGALLLS